MEYLSSLAGIKLEHVVYRGSSLVMKDLLAGHILTTMDNLPPYLQHIQSGGLRALGVSSAKRWFAAPDVPTIAEQGYAGFDAAPWWYVAAPAGTGVHLIMGCGYYVNDYQDPKNHGRTVDDFAAEMIGQILEGAWGTDIRAGMIGEIGCTSPWTDTEKRVMQAALVAAAETGAAINVHPGRDPDQPQEVADFIKAAGHPTDRIVISHIDRTIFDEARLLKLADSGVTIEFDLFGQEASYYGLSDIDMPNDATRLKLIRALIAHGHLERVVISHDICYRTRLASFGGHGYGHIFRNVVPMMKKRGYSEAEIDAILVGNPRRLLTFA